MRLISLLRRRTRAHSQGGFTMIVAMAALLIVLTLTMAAFTAVNGDLPLSANDSAQKQAYAAAQAGIQRYLFALDQNSEFWTECVPAGSTWINDAGSTANQAPVPGSASEKYAVELLPAAGQTTYTQCSTSNPVASMVQASGTGGGTIRIRSTGFSGTVKRSIIAQLREQSFLDYEWFTNYETSDPILQVAENYNATGDPGIEPPDLCALNPTTGCGSGYSQALSGATAQCGQYRYPPPSGSASTVGYDRYTNSTAVPGYPGAFYRDRYGTFHCDQISFISQDTINGPFHTNDQAGYCGTPTFGRNSADTIETGYVPGFVQNSNCGTSGTPIIKGTQPSTITILKPPPSNTSLESIAGLLFTGTTCIKLSPTAISVAQPNSSHPSCFSTGLTWTSYAYPSNGVLYVKNATCGLIYDVDNPSYSGNTGCGTVYVQGTDGPPLTIAAENDIVIDGNLLYNDSASMLGLIANNFIRVYHPIGYQPLGTNSSECYPNRNATGSISGLTIDAMLLSLQHSFVVDQYNCGSGLGNLTVNGGIAQNFRGPVGTSSGSTIVSGYAKAYTYDDRLRYEEPPHFIDPVEGAWRVARQTECDTGGC